MKDEHNGHRIAPGCTASLSATPVSQPDSPEYEDDDVPAALAVQNGSPFPADICKHPGHQRRHLFATVIGIDPGVSGGVAFKREGQAAEAVAMPNTEGDLVALLRQLAVEPANTVAFVEEVSGYAGSQQPGSRMFTFGRNFGFIVGVLQTLGVRVELVRPQRWQKALALGTASGCSTKTIWKNKLKACAQRLYPHLRVTLQISDALLILEYSRKVRRVDVE
jgi:hypothetical protein